MAGSSFGGKGRELAPWETLALGALAGAVASVTTCPADVMKTRVMTAAAEKAVDPKQILLDIVRNEGVGVLCSKLKVLKRLVLLTCVSTDKLILKKSMTSLASLFVRGASMLAGLYIIRGTFGEHGRVSL